MTWDETLRQSDWWLMVQVKKNSCFLHGNSVGPRETLVVLLSFAALVELNE